MSQVNTRKRGKTWEYRFEGAMVEGKRKQISKSGFRTKADALAAGTQALADYNASGTYVKVSEISVADFFDYWYETHCLVNLKETTYKKYMMYMNHHIKPAIGNYKLKAITTKVVQDFISSKHKDGYSRNTIMNLKGVLTNAFGYAIDLDYIVTNPASRAKVPTNTVGKSKKERTALTREEILKIFERFPETHTSYIPLLIGYRCGTRIAESFALTWDDIDLDTGTLDINKQIQWLDSKWVFTDCKYGSERKIRIDSTLIAALRNYKQHQEKNKEYYDEFWTELYVNDKKQLDTSGTPVNMVCRKENGSYLQSRVMQHTSKVIHKELGIEHFDYHSLRHTHATMLLEAGADIKDVQKRLGHKNIKMTLEIYSHATQKMEDRTVSILENIK